jgi:hypothetical protein
MIFISYREKDSAYLVDRLRGDLVRRYGPGIVFRDKNDLRGGQNWAEVLEERVRACPILLAVIGAGWDSARYEDGDRKNELGLDDPDDWVRREIRTALDLLADGSGRVVIPILVGDASLPAQGWLRRRRLAELADWQGMRLRAEPDYSHDLARLCEQLEQVCPALRSLPPVRRWTRREVLATLGATTLAAGAGGSAWLAWKRAEPPAQASPQPITGDLEVKIYTERRGWIDLEDAQALPLQADDGYKIIARVNRPAYAYILLIKPDGVVLPVYPWSEPGVWQARPSEERPLTPDRPFVFEPPQGTTGWQVPTGPAGMLTLLLLARQTPLPAHEDVARLIGPVRPQTEQHLKAKAWFENGLIVRGRPHRGADFEARSGNDPVFEVQQRVRKVLLGEDKPFTYSLAVTFATKGRPAKK